MSKMNLGIIGGGQLGSLLSVAAKKLNIKTIIYSDDENAPAQKFADEFIFGELKLNLDAHQVFIQDNEIAFTALEFRLLKHLIDRRGRVQSRDQLLEEGWGYSAEVTTRTVDTHIKRLREKLRTTGEYIQTIRGVGYRFSKTPH